MGPISGVDAGMGGLAAYQPPAVAGTHGTPVSGLDNGSSIDGGISVTATSTASTSVTISTVQAAVAQTLQSLDEDLADNKLLQMVIALLIFLAILQHVHQQGESAGQGLNNLGQSSGGRSSCAIGYASSTTIETQHYVSTSVAVEAFGANGVPAGGLEQAGGQIDVSV